MKLSPEKYCRKIKSLELSSSWSVRTSQPTVQPDTSDDFKMYKQKSVKLGQNEKAFVRATFQGVGGLHHVSVNLILILIINNLRLIKA